MADAASECVPHGSQGQNGQPVQKPPPNPEALGPCQQEPTNINVMQGGIPPKIVESMECKCLIERISFSIDAAQTIVPNHGYDTTKKLSCLNPNNVDILIKTLCAPGRECLDRTKDTGMKVPRLAHHALISLFFILFHQVYCDLCLTFNGINDRNVYVMDLQ